MSRLSYMFIALACVAGCAQRDAQPPKHTQALSVSKPEKNANAKRNTPPQPKSREPFSTVGKIERGDIPTAVQVTIYQLSVPYGTVSRNEKFWKRIDESVIDINSYETLFKNGVRVGEAPTEEWEYFKKIVEENPAV